MKLEDYGWYENFKKLYSEVKDLAVRKKQKELYISRARKREREGGKVI